MWEVCIGLGQGKGRGSNQPTLCDPGWYCPTDGLDAPFAECKAGYYCTLESPTMTPSGVGGMYILYRFRPGKGFTFEGIQGRDVPRHLQGCFLGANIS